MFADDINFYCSTRSPEDCLILQNDIKMYCLIGQNTGCYLSMLQNVRFYTLVTLRIQVTIL